MIQLILLGTLDCDDKQLILLGTQIMLTVCDVTNLSSSLQCCMFPVTCKYIIKFVYYIVIQADGDCEPLLYLFAN